MKETANIVGMNPDIFELIKFDDKDIAASMKLAIITILKSDEKFENNDNCQRIAS